ncbi:helix-turn-helix transcriptional regulator [Thermoactinomyces sp. DSM 45892]|uniref:helix-turn-helix domain-containing protein n=1 Tax=Thermoactinomyces sp. DSM 45892 TaxID=1882753 RepID=UPI00089808CD|nr:helix-turn-helix transcriptional regulator [Thermoactinomyces sp. DSM 45892]SDY00011.1 Helix-turn-helix domain-containing protein [Thermoactinomyces sp. DSM 45892]
MQLSTMELGETIRSYRKERGLRLEDLADDQISVSTISNIERGYSHVKEEKVRYLLEKLGIDFHQLNALETKQKQKDDLYLLELKAVETWISSGNSKRAWEWLKKNRLSETHALAHFYHFSKGKYYFSQEDYEKAISEYQMVLRITKVAHVHHPLELECYREICHSLYLLKSYEQALEVADRGMEWIEEGEKRKKNKDAELTLAGLRVLCLIQLERMNEAYYFYSSFWSEVPLIRSSYLIIQLYMGKVRLSRALGLNKEAIQLLEEAIRWCGENGEYSLVCECWLMLANVYHEQGLIEFADVAYRTALALEDRIKERSLVVQTYLEYGMFYLKEQQYEAAREKIEQVVFLSKRWNDFTSLAKAYVYLGDLQVELNQLENGLNQYLQAKEIAKKGSTQIRLLVLERLAETYRTLEDDPKFMDSLIEKFAFEQELREKAGH